MENEIKSLNISKNRFLKILMDAYQTGSAAQNITLKGMLKYLESKLRN